MAEIEVRVYIPGPLRSYTKERADVSLEVPQGATMRKLLEELDLRFPGIRFRMIDEADQIREHIRLFVEGEQAASLDVPCGKEVQIICAISGGLQRGGESERLLSRSELKEIAVDPIDGT